MGALKWYQVVGLWIAWTVLLATIAALGVRFLLSTGGNWSLPLPTRVIVNGRSVSPALAIAVQAILALVILYLPPIVATVLWLRRRGTHGAAAGRA
jgi:hypothetical protein